MLDIVIPVYNEGENILAVLTSLERNVKTTCRVLLCYDFEEDDTLSAVRESWKGTLPVLFVKNRGRGAHDAVVSGFDASEQPYVIVFAADDDYNAGILDSMVALAQDGHAVVCASRFMPGGSMINCPPLKAVLVRAAAFTLHRFAALPTHDATNGFRLFSRRLLERVEIESTQGFSYSLELLAKCHRLGWPIGQVPARWIERTRGRSRFKVLGWIPHYLRWYLYVFATTYLRRGPETVATPQISRPCST